MIGHADETGEVALSVSVVVLSFNEAPTLASVTEATLLCLRDLGVKHLEVIIVDDGSSDGSRQIAETLAHREREVRLVFHPRNLGIGEALRTGYHAATLDVVVAIPGDGQFEVSELRHVLTLSRNEFISFFRHENESYGPLRNGLSFANRFLNRHLIGLDMRDVNWVTAFWREDVVCEPLEIHSSLVQSEICGKLVKRGRSVREIPSNYLPRRAGSYSKGASPRIVVQALRDTLRVRAVVRRSGSRCNRS